MEASYYGPELELTRKGLLQLLLEAIPESSARSPADLDLIDRFCGTFRLEGQDVADVEGCVERRLRGKLVASASRFDPLSTYAAALEQAFCDRRISPKEKTYLKLFGGLLSITSHQHSEAVARVKSKLDQSGIRLRHPPELSVPEIREELPEEVQTPALELPPARRGAELPHPASPPVDPDREPPRAPAPPRKRDTAPRPSLPKATGVKPSQTTAPQPTLSKPAEVSVWIYRAVGLLFFLGLPALRYWSGVTDQNAKLVRELVNPEPRQARVAEESPYDRARRARSEANKRANAGEYALAERSMREALSLNTNRLELADMRNDLAWFLCKMNRFPEAEKEYRVSVELDPRHFKALCGLGVVINRSGRSAEALEYFKKAVELKPDSSEAHFLVGTTLIGLGRRDEAIVELKLVVKQDKNNIDAAMVLMELENSAKLAPPTPTPSPKPRATPSAEGQDFGRR